MKKKLFCGIDISKDTLDYAIICGENKEIKTTSQTENNKKGIQEIIRHLQTDYDGADIWVCFEHTGNYGLLLASLLAENNIRFSMVSSLSPGENQTLLMLKE